MSKKNIAKLGLSAAVAASALIAGNPAQAASVSEADKLVNDALASSNALKPYFSVTTEDKVMVSPAYWTAYNKAGAAIKKAQGLSLNSDQKTKLASAEETRLKAARFIDAVKLGEVLAEKTAVLEAKLDAQLLDETTVSAYGEVSAAIKKFEAASGKVTGTEVRKTFNAKFLVDAKISREVIKYEIDRYNLHKIIFDLLEEKNVEEAKIQVAKLERLETRSVQIKEDLKKLYPEINFELTKVQEQLTAQKAEAGKMIEELDTPKVASVSAINAKQIKVTFNKELDKTTAEDESKYSVQGSALAAGTATATLQEDKMSVVVTLNTPLVNGNAYSVSVEGVKTSGSVEVPKFSTSFVANDKVAPSITKVEAKASTAGTKTVTVTFDEPVNTLGSYRINDVAVTASAGSTPNEVVLTSATTLASGDYTLAVLSTTDFANNTISPISKAFKVESDSAKPVIQTISAADENTVKVVFDKKVASTFATDTTITIDKIGVATGTLTASNVRVDSNDTTGKTLLFDVPTSSPNVYATNESSANIIVGLKGTKDVSGNVMDEVKNQSVVLSKDVTKPGLVSSELKSDNTALYFTFNEEVRAVGVLNNTGVRVINNEGVDVTSTALPALSILEADKTVGDSIGPVLQVGLGALPVGTYTITVPANKLEDNTLTGNKYDGVITYTFEVKASTDTTKPAITSVTGSATGFAVLFDRPVKGGAVAGSATDVANYQVNGKPLPVGTVITLDSAKTTATVTFPANSIAKDEAAVLTVSGIQSGAGVTMDAVPSRAVTNGIQDNTLPTVTKAEAIADNKLVLTFSEAVTAEDVTGNELTLGAYTVEAGKDGASISIVNNVVTITKAGIGAIDLSTAKLNILAGSFADKSAATNGIAAASTITVADKFASVTGASVAATDANTTGVANLSEILVNITAPTNAGVDKVSGYDIYVTPSTTASLTTVADVEAALTKVASFTASQVGSAIALPSGTRFSDGTVVDNTFNATVKTYVVVKDEAGNKALVPVATSGAPINLTN